jgi:hypothetical protein
VVVQEIGAQSIQILLAQHIATSVGSAGKRAEFAAGPA